MNIRNIQNLLLIESLNKKNDILKYIKIICLSYTVNNEYIIKTQKLIDYINDKFNIVINFKILSDFLSKIKIIENFDEETITLYQSYNKENTVSNEYTDKSFEEENTLTNDTDEFLPKDLD